MTRGDAAALKAEPLERERTPAAAGVASAPAPSAAALADADELDFTVLIPTYKRLARLAQTLASLGEQRGIDKARCEVLVIDNCPDGSARPVVEGAALAPMRVRYLQEPRPGVSHVRNAGLRHARGEIIAFIDDDETADPMWLNHLRTAHHAWQADIVFGRVIPVFEAELPPRLRFLRRELDRRTAPTGTPYAKLHGTNGTSVLRRACRNLSFRPELSTIGGEDVFFFRELAEAGCKLIYSYEAAIYDPVPAERTTFKFWVKRRFSQGQRATYARTLRGGLRAASVARSMTTGTVEFCVYGAAALVSYALGSDAAGGAALRSARGLGKLLWMRPFRLSLYGHAG